MEATEEVIRSVKPIDGYDIIIEDGDLRFRVWEDRRDGEHHLRFKLPASASIRLTPRPKKQ